jgi:hypothetical protein
MFAVPGLAVLAVVVSQTGLNWIIRYLLPAYPFFFLATGRPIASVRPENTHFAFDASQELVESRGNDSVRSDDL